MYDGYDCDICVEPKFSMIQSKWTFANFLVARPQETLGLYWYKKITVKQLLQILPVKMIIKVLNDVKELEDKCNDPQRTTR